MLDRKMRSESSKWMSKLSSVEFYPRIDRYFILGLILAILITLIGNYSYIVLAIVIFYFLKLKWDDRFLLFISILLYLTFITDIIHSFRLYVQILGFLLLLYLFIKRFGLRVSEYPRLPKNIVLLIVVFYLSMILATVFSEYFLTGVTQILKQTIFFLIIYIIYSFLNKIENIRTVLLALVISTLIIAVSILYEYALNDFSIINYVKGTQIRISGILGNINASGSYFGALFPVTLTSLYIVKKGKKRVILYLINTVLILGIIFSTSRSAYLSIIVSVLFIYLILNKKRLSQILLGLMFLIIIIWSVPQLNNFFLLFFRIESGLSQRSHLWKLSMDIIKAHPFFGIGPGSYSFEMLNYFPVLIHTWVGQELINLRDMTLGANNSHNFFLFFMSDMGIGGLISSLLFPAVFISTGIKAIKKYVKKNNELFYLSVGLMAAGLGLFARGFFEGIGLLTYGWVTMDLPFWLIFIVLISISNYDFFRSRLIKTQDMFANQKIHIIS